MNLELLLYVILAIVIVTASYAAGRLLLITFRLQTTSFLVCTAPALGLATAGLQLWCYGLLHIPWSLITLLIPWVILAFVMRRMIALELKREKYFIKRGAAIFMSMDSLGKTFAIGSIVFILGYLLQFIVEPFITSDLLAMWGYKAKEFFEHQQVFVNSGLNASLASARFFHIDYPPLLPLMADTTYVIAGNINETLFKLIQLVFVVSGASTLFVFLRSQLPKQIHNLSIIFTFLFVAAPQFMPFLFDLKYMGYADYPLAVFMMLSTIFMVRAFQKPLGYNWWLAFFFASMASVTKNEGLAFLAIILLILGWQALIEFKNIRTLLQPKKILVLSIGIVIMLLPAGLWFYYRTTHQIPVDFSISNLAKSGMSLQHRFRIIFEYIWTYIRTNPMFHWEVAAFIVAIVLTAWKRNKIVVAVGLVVMLQLASYITSYLFSPYDLQFHVLSSIDRLMTQLLPIIILWLAILLSYTRSTKATRSVKRL